MKVTVGVNWAAVAEAMLDHAEEMGEVWKIPVSGDCGVILSVAWTL